MRLVPGIHTIDEVEKARARVWDLIANGLVTTQRAQEANSITKQFAVGSLEELHDQLVEFLEREKLGSPDTSITSPYFLD